MLSVVNNNRLLGTSRHENFHRFVVIAVGALVERARRASLPSKKGPTPAGAGLVTLLFIPIEWYSGSISLLVPIGKSDDK